MLEHAIYTVASPEAAASILWRDSARAMDAATNMKITAQDLLKLGVIDGIIAEPVGGAHRDGIEVMRSTGDTIVTALAAYDELSPAEIRKERREKFLSIGRPV
jgi:acetyl-CoA carboxylase carboxyl transferase subunit alpha